MYVNSLILSRYALCTLHCAGAIVLCCAVLRCAVLPVLLNILNDSRYCQVSHEKRKRGGNTHSESEERSREIQVNSLRKIISPVISYRLKD